MRDIGKWAVRKEKRNRSNFLCFIFMLIVSYKHSAAAIFTAEFVYLTDGTPSGTTVLGEGVATDSESAGPGIALSSEALMYNSVVGTVNMVHMPPCVAGDVTHDKLCIGGYSVTPFSELSCRGDPPRPGSICSLGRWLLPGGWIVQTNQSISISLEQPTIVEGDLRFQTVNATAIKLSLTDTNTTIAVEGCIDLSALQLTIGDAFYGASQNFTKIQVDLITFDSFCNNRKVCKPENDTRVI